MQEEEMTFIDLFAGVGGFRKGLELAGHKCLGFCEYDKFAVQSYRAIHKTEGEWYAKDIREVRADDIPRADMWCAGFPCQDISVAGKQLGFRGKRSSLFFTVTGLVRDLEEKDKPAILFFENVKNLLSVNRGVDFARLLIELDKIGYDAEWSLINSADVVPQNRERMFLIGHLRGRDRQQVFPIRQSNEQDFELQGCKTGTITTRTGTANTVGTYVAESQQHAQESIGGLYSGVSESFFRGILPNCSRTLKSNKHDACVAIKQVGQIYGTEKEPNPQEGRVYSSSGISPSLDTCQGGNRMPKIAVSCLTPDRINKRQNGRRFKNNNDPMFTLTGQDRHGVLIKTATKSGYEFATANRDSINLSFPNSKTRRGRVGKDKAQTLDTSCNQGVSTLDKQNNIQIRKLTPLECWRLQGWQDEDFFKAFFLDKDLGVRFSRIYHKHIHNPVRLMQWAYKHQKMSDSQLYKQAGNGVTVTVIQKIGERI